MGTPAEFVNISDAARAAGVTRRTVQRWIDKGRLRVYRREGGGWPLVRVDDVVSLARIVPAGGAGERDTEGDADAGTGDDVS